MAGIYLQKKDWASAEAAYKKSLEIKPDYAEATVGLSNVLVNTSRGAEAADLVGQALAANPTDTKLLLQQGVLFFNTGKQAEAAEVLKKIVAADPTSAEPYYYLGTIAVGQGNTAECIANLEKYLSLNPQNATNVATAKGLIAALKK
jgi:cytochrome c-type biogenesis protein CcmH/NrfG